MEKQTTTFQWLRPKNDFLFKLIFGSDDEASKELLLAFLNDVLDVPIGQSLGAVEIVTPMLNKQDMDDKNSILDIKAKVIGYGYINIEVQLTNQKNIHKRSLYYGAKLYEEQLGKGDDYHKLTRVVAINLIGFSFFTSDHYRSCYCLMEEHTHEPFPDLMQLHFIEMTKFVVQDQEKAVDRNDRTAKWLRFLTNEDDSRWEEMAKQDPIIEKAVEILKAASLDPQTRMRYEAREKALKDINSIRGDGLREGMKKGKTFGKEEVAKKMLKKGLDIEAITEFTDLSKEAVLDIEEEINNK